MMSPKGHMLPTPRNLTSTDRLVIATGSVGDPGTPLEEIVEVPALDARGECFHFSPSIGELGAIGLGRAAEKNKLSVACHHYTCPPVARP